MLATSARVGQQNFPDEHQQKHPSCKVCRVSSNEITVLLQEKSVVYEVSFWYYGMATLEMAGEPFYQ
jgi:hypothetical protein